MSLEMSTDTIIVPVSLLESIHAIISHYQEGEGLTYLQSLTLHKDATAICNSLNYYLKGEQDG